MRLYLSSFRVGNRPEELLRLLDGDNRTGLVLNADDYKSPQDRSLSLQREFDELRALGLQPSEIDLRDYFGRPGALQQHLTHFSLVYVRGGNPFILRRAFSQSGADDIIEGLLAKDAIVYGGYSAGAIMLGPSLRGIETIGTSEDDPAVVPDGYLSEPLWQCLHVIPYAIVPHYRSTWGNVGAAMEKLVDYYVQTLQCPPRMGCAPTNPALALLPERE